MRRPNRLVAETLFPAVAVAGLVFMLHYVPFYAPSFLAWTGIAAALAGLVSLARPLRFLGVRTRVHGLALALALCGRRPRRDGRAVELGRAAPILPHDTRGPARERRQRS